MTPRGPLSLPPGGNHWYAFQQVGYPDPATFFETYRAMAEWLDAFDFEHVVLGGFSQGAVMTYALGLGAGRPRPAALVAMSGFVPTVEGFEVDLASTPPVAIGHGVYDDVISVEFGRDARSRLEEAGGDVLYREYLYPHAVDPHFLRELRPWIAKTLAFVHDKPLIVERRSLDFAALWAASLGTTSY